MNKSVVASYANFLCASSRARTSSDPLDCERKKRTIGRGAWQFFPKGLKWAVVMGLLMRSVSGSAAEPKDVLGWWRMDAEIGDRVGGKRIVNAAHTGERYDGIAHSWEGGSLVAFHELPGRYIYDPLTGKAWRNQTSLRFQTTGQNDGAGTSDYIEIDGGIGKLHPKAFTIEGFIKIEGSIGKWHFIIGMRRPEAPHPHSWSLSTENLRGERRLRYGGHRSPRGYWGSYEKSPRVDRDGWNHFAYVFDASGDERVARLYWNGELVSESKPPMPAWSDDERLYIGGAPGSAGWTGYLDEVRFTLAALAPNQFLRASDTPGKPEGPATPVSLGLRREAPPPLERPVVINLPPPIAGPAEVHVPGDAGLINVKTDYGAKGDGLTDDTDAIRRAVAENVGKHRTLYFPPGVYIVSEPIDWRNTKGAFNCFLTWQGAGMGRTIIYLRDGAVAFGAPERPAAITRSGSIPGMGGTNPVTGAGNRAHNNYIMDMTFVVGKNNPGAIGVDFNASNTGAMENVRIIALDRALEGLRLTRQVGCLLIRNVEIHGFDIGVRLGGDLYGSTLAHIHLSNQAVVGLLNTGHMVALQKLISHNRVPAIRNRGEQGQFAETGLMVLIDSHLTGNDSGVAAIENETALLARNVTIQGYGVALKQGDTIAVQEDRIEEYVWPSPMTLFAGTPSRSLFLPVVDPPQLSTTTPNTWASVAAFGAVANGMEDQSEAIQKAIDSGAETLYFPQGTYRIFQPVIVRGRVRRIIGYQSWLIGAERNVATEGRIEFQNENPVTFERFNFRNLPMIVNSGSPVILRHLMNMSNVLLAHDRATVFSENTVGGYIALRPEQTWRAWQLNIEMDGPPAMVENQGGTFWVLGYKTEKGNTVLRAVGGRSEILGGLWYPAQGVRDETRAAIEILDADLSASFTDVAKWAKGQYPIAVRETRAGERREIRRSDLQRRWGLSGSIALFRSTGSEEKP